MKYFLLLGIIALLSYIQAEELRKKKVGQYLEQKRADIAYCSPLRSKEISSSPIGLLPGTGKHQWAISTRSDSAQIYFNQGINLYYSFHIIESLASFLKAQQFDKQNPMLYWAEALAYGPNINDLGYTQSPDVMAAVNNAVKYMDKASDMEKGLILAMQRRYSEDGGATRESLNTAYRDAMAALYRTYPNNPEVVALYGDALMVMHPWDLYEGNGDPKPWTPELVAVLEKGLSVGPQHPGLNHYYIHAVEGSRTPERGLPSANRLGSIVPSAAHMVHMPSHIYIRTGNYAKGVDVNVRSRRSHEVYQKLYPAVSNNLFIYLYHNTHMLAACAIMNGNSGVAIRAAEQCHQDIGADEFKAPPPYNEMIQYIYATPVFAMVRYGKWDELIRMPMPADSLKYYSILADFGKGIAYARTGKILEAEQALASMTRKMEADTVLKIRAFNTAYDAAMVGRYMVEGIIAEEKKDLAAAEKALLKAAELEENMVYNEPKDWLLPPLQYLGQVQLKAGKFADAERTFRKDLGFNPHNLWSLQGLKQALAGQGKPAGDVGPELAKAMKGADARVKHSVY